MRDASSSVSALLIAIAVLQVEDKNKFWEPVPSVAPRVGPRFFERRLVFNLKHVNEYHVKRACKFGSLSSLRRTLHEGDQMWSIDLSDAYHLT